MMATAWARVRIMMSLELPKAGMKIRGRVGPRVRVGVGVRLGVDVRI